jgi:hypothetical protein
MKARTRGQKKRGRPKKEGVFREASGRPSRAEDPPQKTATEARARLLGLSVIDAQNPEAASWLGRLHMAYVTWQAAQKKTPENSRRPQPELSISTAQYYAALSYLTLTNNRSKALQSEGAVYDNQSIWRTSSDEAEHARWCADILAEYDKVRDAIQEAQGLSRTANLWAALDFCVLRDMEMPHMIGDLRMLLNAMNRHYRKGKRKAA